MAYGMEDGETRDIMTYPDEGVRAVDVPLSKIEVLGNSGALQAKDEDVEYFKDLGDGSGTGKSFDQIRSIVIFSTVDIEIQDLYGEPVGFQAGWTLLQGVPESESFTIDYGADKQDLVPEEAQTKIMLFNTPELPAVVNEKAVRMALDNVKTVNSTEWQTVMLQPAFPFDDKAFRFENTGDNTLEYRIVAHNAGKAQPEPLDNAGSRVKELGAGDLETYYNNTATDFLELQAREKSSENPSDIEATYSGAGY